MPQGQVPNIIHDQALRPDEIFRRIYLYYIGVSVDALWSLLEGAGPGGGSLQLESLGKLLPQRHLKAVVFVIAIRLVRTSGRTYPQVRHAENRICCSIGGNTGDCTTYAGRAHPHQLGYVIGAVDGG